MTTSVRCHATSSGCCGPTPTPARWSGRPSPTAHHAPSSAGGTRSPRPRTAWRWSTSTTATSGRCRSSRASPASPRPSATGRSTLLPDPASPARPLGGRRVPPPRRVRAVGTGAGRAPRRHPRRRHRRRAAAVVHRRRQRPPAELRPRGDLHAEGVPAARRARLGARRHRAAAPRADDRLRHSRGHAAVHATVHQGPRPASTSPPSPRSHRTRRGATTARCGRPSSPADATGRRRCGPPSRPSGDGAGVDGVLDVVVDAVAERMLRYDPAGSSTSTTTSAGSTSPTVSRTPTPSAGMRGTPRPAIWIGRADVVRLALWCVFLAHWTGRHEWHTGVGEPVSVDLGTTDLAAAGQALQRAALGDTTTAFIVHAHAVKTSRAATEEALRAAARPVRWRRPPASWTRRSSSASSPPRSPARSTSCPAAPGATDRGRLHVGAAVHGAAGELRGARVEHPVVASPNERPGEAGEHGERPVARRQPRRQADVAAAAVRGDLDAGLTGDVSGDVGRDEARWLDVVEVDRELQGVGQRWAHGARPAVACPQPVGLERAQPRPPASVVVGGVERRPQGVGLQRRTGSAGRRRAPRPAVSQADPGDPARGPAGSRR